LFPSRRYGHKNIGSMAGGHFAILLADFYPLKYPAQYSPAVNFSKMQPNQIDWLCYFLGAQYP
jgi:hypothetical protein